MLIKKTVFEATLLCVYSYLRPSVCWHETTDVNGHGQCEACSQAVVCQHWRNRFDKDLIKNLYLPYPGKYCIHDLIHRAKHAFGRGHLKILSSKLFTYKTIHKLKMKQIPKIPPSFRFEQQSIIILNSRKISTILNQTIFFWDLKRNPFIWILGRRNMKVVGV